jgi:hypothetical protein
LLRQCVARGHPDDVCQIRRRLVDLAGQQRAKRSIDQTENPMPHLANERIDNLGRRLDPTRIHRDTRIFVIGGGHSGRPHSGLEQSAIDGLVCAELIEQ